MISKIFDLSGKRALVTGSSRGIGRAIARIYGEAGAKVYFHGSTSSVRLDEVLAEAQSEGFDCASVTADLSDRAAVENMMRQTGPLDILAMNASVQKYMTLEEFDPAEFDREFHANVQASFQMVQAVLPGMIERRFGRIIAIGSVNQYKPSPRLGVYAATKAAQLNLITNLARNYAQYGITANNIAPGVIATDRNREALEDQDMVGQLLSAIPSGRFGQPADCAGVALLLASAAGAYITGADIPVAGGMQV